MSFNPNIVKLFSCEKPAGSLGIGLELKSAICKSRRWRMSSGMSGISEIKWDYLGELSTISCNSLRLRRSFCIIIIWLNIVFITSMSRIFHYFIKRELKSHFFPRSTPFEKGFNLFSQWQVLVIVYSHFSTSGSELWRRIINIRCQDWSEKKVFKDFSF